MVLKIGQVLRRKTRTYRLIEALKGSTVFKAQVLPTSSVKAGFAVVKTETEPKKICLKRERHNHSLSAVASCQYIRALFDVIGTDEEDVQARSISATQESLCLVFEWMERDLRTVPSDNFRQNSALPAIIAKSVLSALALLKSQYNGIHTDINPNNIFLSGINGPSPVVKVGDLGNSEYILGQAIQMALNIAALREGFKGIRLQSLPTRAPEVWRGLGCWHSSDVWSLGVTLVHWLSPSIIFGAKDKIVQDLTEAWCIAKIRRLVGPLGPPVDNPVYQEEFLIAEHLESTTFQHPDTNLETRFITVGDLRHELQRLPGPKVSHELIEFIMYLLVVDHEKRPGALEALEHSYVKSLPQKYI